MRGSTKHKALKSCQCGRCRTASSKEKTLRKSYSNRAFRRVSREELKNGNDGLVVVSGIYLD